jgi:pSer/pThr/pTyr-binding forkhead associated (FHA) protein
MALAHQATAEELKARIEAERAGGRFLVYFDGEGRQLIVRLEEDVRRLTVGRTTDADVCLGWDARVSRLHAELELVGEHWVIADEGLSRNGTYVNESRVTGRRRLVDHDVVRVGDTAIVYRAPAGNRAATTVLGEHSVQAASISPAQRRVLIALCRPYRGGASFATPATNPEIARELFLSVPAVKTHLRALCQKLGVEDLPQQEKRQRLVAVAFATGLVTERDLEQA